MLFRRENRNNYSLSDPDRSFAKLLNLDIDGDIPKNKLRETTYYTCMRILTDSVSKLPLKLYKDTDKGIEKATDHYLYNLLKLRPNKNMSSSDFWKCIEFQRNEYGHAVAVIETDRSGKITALHPLDMSKTSIYLDPENKLGLNESVWYVHTSASGEKIFKTDEVLHFKGMTPDGINGIAVKEYLKTNIENLQYSANYINKHFAGGLSVKGVMHYIGDLDDNAAVRMKQRIEKGATGTDNIGKILTLPPGFSFSPLSTSMADAQFFEIYKLSMAQIASAFGIKQHMINDLSGAKFNNVTQQNEEFYRDTLQSILYMYEQELTYKLLTEGEVRTGMYFNFNVDSILRSDLKTRYEAYGLGIEKGFLTPNEVREKEGLPKVEGGDQLVMNGTMQPLNKVGMAYTQPANPAQPVNEEESQEDEEEIQDNEEDKQR